MRQGDLDFVGGKESARECVVAVAKAKMLVADVDQVRPVFMAGALFPHLDVAVGVVTLRVVVVILDQHRGWPRRTDSRSFLDEAVADSFAHKDPRGHARNHSHDSQLSYGTILRELSGELVQGLGCLGPWNPLACRVGKDRR